jgi:hypothetical protein
MSGTLFTNNNSSPFGMSDVSSMSSVVREMHNEWRLVETLRGGTAAMRKVPEYLPKNTRESDEHYRNRLQRSFLYNLYTRTLSSVTGLAFTTPVVVRGLPDELKYLEYDFDGTGRSITEVAYDLTVNALHFGVAYAIVDYPAVDTGNMTLAEWRESGIRPYINVIRPTSILGWRTNETRTGPPTVEQFRFVEQSIVPFGEFGEKFVKTVSVYEANKIRLYQSVDSALNYTDKNAAIAGYQYEEASVLSNSLGYVPLVTAYGNKTGFMTGRPALYSLAELNLRHWQSSSEQNNILHFTRVPFLFAFGFNEGDLQNLEIGASLMVVSSNPEARIQHVEHSGNAIGAGRTDLRDLENQMAALGADALLGKGVGRITATARRLDQNESLSVLQMAIKSVERALERAIIIAADWIDADIDEEGLHVTIADGMSVANEPNPSAALKLLMSTGLFTDEQVIEEARRHGIVSSHFQLKDDRPKNLLTAPAGETIDFSSIPTPENIEEATPEADTTFEQQESMDSSAGAPNALDAPTEVQNGSKRNTEDEDDDKNDKKKQDMIDRLLQYIMK